MTGKYGKTRLLPLHPSVLTGLTDYLDARAPLLPAGACPALLISSTGRRLPPSTVHPTFRAVVKAARLEPVRSACRPRLHDLRHTFAVTTMLDAYRSGADPAAVLPFERAGRRGHKSVVSRSRRRSWQAWPRPARPGTCVRHAGSAGRG